jgi:hypothetical protein
VSAPLRPLALLLLVLADATACVSMSAEADLGPRISADVLEAIVPGETGRAEVLARLGPPDEYLRSEVAGALDDDALRLTEAVQLGNRALDVLTWQHDRLRMHGRWWLFVLRARTTVRSDLLMIVFDEHEVVSEVSFREAAE